MHVAIFPIRRVAIHKSECVPQSPQRAARVKVRHNPRGDESRPDCSASTNPSVSSTNDLQKSTNQFLFSTNKSCPRFYKSVPFTDPLAVRSPENASFLDYRHSPNRLQAAVYRSVHRSCAHTQRSTVQ